MNPFRAAIEARHIDAAVALMSEDVVFHSPVVFKPYTGRAAVSVLLNAVATVFEDFRYDREIGGPEDADHALVFRARVGDREVHGCDFVHTNAVGEIDELTVMVRPLSGAHALADAMAAKLAEVGRALAAG